MKRLLDQADLPEYAVHENSPHADDWEDPDAAPTMSRAELIRLAGQGDRAALDVIDSCLECVGEIELFNSMSDEERAAAYVYFVREPLRADLDARIFAANERLTASINSRCDAEQRAARLRYITVRREFGQRFRRLREALL